MRPRYVRVAIDKRRTKFCPDGHDKDLVGRNKKGVCILCSTASKLRWANEHEEYFRQWRLEHREEVFKTNKEWRRTHQAEIQKYEDEHKEERRHKNTNWCKNNPGYFKRWRDKHPDSVSASNLKNTTNRRLRIVPWTDWDKINEFERNKPGNMTTDHIIPLQGKLVSGLHVSWNLQYLPKSQNFSKQHKVNLLEASERQGKILEQAGLK